MTLPILQPIPEFDLPLNQEMQLDEDTPINPHTLIQARNDVEAIQCWLREYQYKATTYRSYRKEAERFLLWIRITLQKTLAQLTREDMEHYSQFLNDPQPRFFWCGAGVRGGRLNKRGEGQWRPFQKGLSPAAQSVAWCILKSMFNYLVDAKYLSSHPLGLMRRQNSKSASFEERQWQIQERILGLDEWQAMQETLRSWSAATSTQRNEKERMRFIVAMLYFLGLRVSELSEHTWQSFRKTQDLWWFWVKGKGDKIGKIPVNPELLDAVIRYRTHFDMSVYPQETDNTPLVFAFRGNKALGPRQINHIIKSLALETAKCFPDNIEKQQKLKKFSPHWLRHLSASMQDRAGIPMSHIRANHRHEKEDTTRLYVHTLDEERHEQMKRLIWEI